MDDENLIENLAESLSGSKEIAYPWLQNMRDSIIDVLNNHSIDFSIDFSIETFPNGAIKYYMFLERDFIGSVFANPFSEGGVVTLRASTKHNAPEVFKSLTKATNLTNANS